MFSPVIGLLLLLASATTVTAFPTYQEKYYNQTLDHFRFTAPTARWQHRYLLNDDNWGKAAEPLGLSSSRGAAGCRGPILFYTGNEGPIDAFWGSNGFMIEHLAPKWGALLVFGEERYYGKSLPFGAKSLTDPANAVYLSTEQVLADYAELLQHLKATIPGAQNCPVVSFGGSYGGTLTTYFRLKYPTAVIGGLAASAPIGYYDNANWAKNGVDQFTWIDIVNKVYREAAPGCLDRLQTIVRRIKEAGATARGRAALAKTFHVCDEAVLGKEPEFFFTDAIETIPQEDYPYAIGSLPAWPVNATCETVLKVVDGDSDSDLLAAAAKVTDMYYGYDAAKLKKCISGEGQGGIPGGGPGPAAWGAWSYQSCTETLHAFSGRGVRNFTFSLDEAKAQCRGFFGVQPDPARPMRYVGGYGIAEGLTGISNVIWSNGLLDPWHGGGFLSISGAAQAAGNHVFHMPQGAHHLDLRGPHPDDPPQVTATRLAEEMIIRQWILDAAAAGDATPFSSSSYPSSSSSSS